MDNKQTKGLTPDDIQKLIDASENFLKWMSKFKDEDGFLYNHLKYRYCDGFEFEADSPEEACHIIWNSMLFKWDKTLNEWMKSNANAASDRGDVRSDTPAHHIIDLLHHGILFCGTDIICYPPFDPDMPDRWHYYDPDGLHYNYYGKPYNPATEPYCSEADIEELLKDDDGSEIQN